MCVVVALTFVSCGGKSEPSATPPPTATAAGDTVVVEGNDQFKFDPATITVKVGQPVRWINHGTLPHTVSFQGAPFTFDKPLDVNHTIDWVFDKAGTFNYMCKYHIAQMMKGTVEVTSG